MTDKKPTDMKERLEEAYEHMLGDAKHFITEARDKGQPVIKEALEAARQKVSDLGELTSEEIDKISDYVERDLVDAARYMQEQERELADWLRLDLLVIEEYLLDKFSTLADQTRIELDKLANDANTYGEWHTGEIVSMGVFECTSCGEQIHFEKPGHVPPCPKCHGTVFKRLHR